MGVEVRGIDATCSSLDSFSAEIRQKILAKAVRAGGKVVQQAIKERTPVLEVKSPGSDSLGPGELLGDIKVKVIQPATDVESAIIGPSRFAHVARWVEYGHRNIRRDSAGTIKLKSRGGGMGKIVGDADTPPHPFIRPAFEASMQEAARVAIETVRKAITSAARAARRS